MTKRQKDDFYATDPRAIKPLFEKMGWLNGGLTIYENSCGQGHLSKPMSEMGHHVISTDLVDRGFGIGGVDFLADTVFHTMKYDAIVMNPPFKHALEFIKRSMALAPVTCAFLRLAFLEGGDTSGRYDFFTDPVTRPSKVLVFSDRVPSAIDGDFENTGTGKTAYAWFIWDENRKSETQLDWIRL